jgi:flagellar biosynthesis protein FlhF
MKIKSYFADSVEAAVTQASKELGVDAMLIETRRSSALSRSLGAYEVVFGVVDDVPPVPAPVQAIAAPAPPQQTGPLADLAEIRRQIADLQSALATSAPSGKLADREDDLNEWRDQLLRADVGEALANEVLRAVRAQFASLAPANRPAQEQIEQAMRRELAGRTPVVSLFSRDRRERAIALVGPPGAGKTVTAVKLAIQEAIAAGNTVHLISLDPYRIAASEQLRVYASLLGAGFDAVQTFGELMQAMTDSRNQDLVIVDTPGFTAAETDMARELAELLAHFEEVSTHLVLPVSMKTADLSRAAEVFRVFGPRSLIFTRLDETDSWGAMLSEAARTGAGISYLCGGQSIPEDLERASADAILGKILGPPTRARSVA